MVDNARLSSDNYDALARTWLALLDVLASVNITIGESTPPTRVMAPYVFLGIHFNHTRRTVSVGPKTMAKLQRAHAALSTNPTALFSARDVAAIYGYCVWGTAVLGAPLHPLYYIGKFIRRLTRRIAGDYNTTAIVWPCIIDLWINWLLALQATRVVAPPLAENRCKRAVAYSDASKTGWGAVVYAEDDRVLTYGARWTLQEAALHINVLETLAVKKLTHELPRLPNGRHWRIALLIDSTTALCWVRKRRSANFIANEIVGDIDVDHVEITSADYVSTFANHADKKSRE